MIHANITLPNETKGLGRLKGARVFDSSGEDIGEVVDVHNGVLHAHIQNAIPDGVDKFMLFARKYSGKVILGLPDTDKLPQLLASPLPKHPEGKKGVSHIFTDHPDAKDGMGLLRNIRDNKVSLLLDKKETLINCNNIIGAGQLVSNCATRINIK